MPGRQEGADMTETSDSFSYWDSASHRREMARQGDAFAKGLGNYLIEQRRQERENLVRLDRVEEIAANPVGTYLTLVHWVMRWHDLCFRRFFRGKAIPFRRDEGFDFWYVGGTQFHVYSHQLRRLKILRLPILLEGQKLDVSPLEMSALLTECQRAIEVAGKWVEALPEGEEESWFALEAVLNEIDEKTKPLRDLLMVGDACLGKTPHTDPERRMTRAKANHRATELAKADRFFVERSQREWANLIHCSEGLVSKLPLWQEKMRRAGGLAAAPKAVRFTDALEKTVGKPNEELQRLIDEQKSDSEPSPLEEDAPDSPPTVVRCYPRL